MPWTKGAVVIRKAGDEEWASEMAKVLDREKEALARDNEWMKRHIVEDLEQKIIEAEINYGYNFVPPRWARPIFEGMALVQYGVAVFVDKFLMIREWKE